ncbi:MULTISPECIES: Ulp1 family isopeptidase [unclassified Bradyrhizobium]
MGPITAACYTQALGRLGNDLGQQGKTINELNHSSLAAHAEQSFPSDAKMRQALKDLHEHRSGTNHLVKAAMQETIRNRGVKPGTAKNHATALRQLAISLESRGETLAGLDHETLLDRAKAAFPGDMRFRPALVSLSKYFAAGDSAGRSGAGEDASGTDGSRQAASSPMLALVPEELRRLLDDRPDESSIMAPPSPRLNGVPAEVWDLFDDAVEEPPTNPVELQRLEQGFREELHGRRDDQRVRSGLAFDAEQFPPAKLRRVLNHLDDQSMPSQASVDPTELLRLQEQLHKEIQRQPDEQPSRSFSVDQEFNLEQFSPGALRRLLDAEPEQPQVPVDPTHLNAGAGVLMQVPLHELERLPTMQHSGHEQPAALSRSSVLSSDGNRPTNFVINTDRYTVLFVPPGMTRQSTPLHPPSAAIGFGSRSESAPQPNAPSGNQASPALPSRRMEQAAPASDRAEAVSRALGETFDVSLSVPEDFSHGTQPAPGMMRFTLGHWGLLPDVAQRVKTYDIRGERYTAVLGPGGPDDVQLIHLRSPAIGDTFDVSFAVPKDFSHRTQPAPDMMLSTLGKWDFLPVAEHPMMNYEIRGERYTAVLGPKGPDDVQLIHHYRIADKSAPAAPSDVYDVLDLPTTPEELTDYANYLSAFPRILSGPELGASGPAASSHDRSGRALGATEWLGDEHIQRDYELLTQELQMNYPNLAARTRFVDPLIAFQLSWGAESDALSALQRIVDDPNGNDGADFLFLPVNDGSVTDPNGTHWSLLLVDRRTRGEPVAYHYDSVQGHNDEPAERLAERLGLTLQRAGMAPQQNSYDCGVFVVDGTRELVRRLAQGERPQHEPLHLNNLVANRQALRDRLRG